MIIDEINSVRKEMQEAEKEISVLNHQCQRYQQRINYLRRSKDRKRTHRLIQYGAVFEHHFKELAVLNDPEIYALVEKIVSYPPVQGMILTAIEQHKPISEVNE